MVAEKVNNNISQGTIDIDNINSYYTPSENAINALDNIDIPRMENIYNKQMRIISKSQPSNPEQGMALFKLFD